MDIEKHQADKAAKNAKALLRRPYANRHILGQRVSRLGVDLVSAETGVPVYEINQALSEDSIPSDLARRLVPWPSLAERIGSREYAARFVP